MKHYENWEEFIKNNDGKLFRMHVYSKILKENKFGEKELFDNKKPRFVFIKESVILPDGDILLGMQEIEDQMYINEYYSDFWPIQYYKLSEIWLVHVPADI